MQDIIQEFEGIDSEPSLRIFLQKNGFRVADSRSHSDQFVLAAFTGKLGESHARITHRLLDEASTRATGLGKNQLTLEVDGAVAVEVRFHGTY